MSPWIGRSVPRKEARAKVTGAARYVDDLVLPGMLHGVTVRSPAPRGRIRDIRFGAGVPWEEIVVVTAQDVPGRNTIELILDDQPCLAAAALDAPAGSKGVVNHPEEPVLLLAHADRYLLEEARRAVTVEIEPLPAIFTIEESLARREVIWGVDNVFRAYQVARGDLAAAFAAADLVVEAVYETGAQEQLYIEPQGMLAEAGPEGVTVRGSMQCPYYVHKALRALFALPGERVRVVQCETGGGFGGKEEYPSMLAAHAALLAWKAARPVKMVYDRAEDMVATTKRHPSRTRLRTGVTRDGRLLALDADFTIDGGAYCTLSPVVLSRGTIHLAGPYDWQAVEIRSRAVATNAPPHGAFRGFGAPQSLFAMECHLDLVAERLGLEPAELRRRNFVRQGATLAVGQTIHEPVDLPGLMARAFEMSGYEEKRSRFARENQRCETSSSTDVAEPASVGARRRSNAARPQVRKGIGFASFLHGAGFTGSGEEHLASVVEVEASAEGRVRVKVASTEIGQGTNTILPQIAADALGIDFDEVELVAPDTAVVPDSGPTVASRTAMVVGKLVEGAALALLQTLRAAELLAATHSPDEFAAACRAHHERLGPLVGSCRYQAPPGVHWDDVTYTGDAYGAYAWAVYVAEVSVDTLTWEVHVDDFVAVQEVGRVLHPVLAAGQIEGGVVQAIGWALCEHVAWESGRMLNAQMTNYIIPTAADVPPIRVAFAETPYAYGPGGAKGIGELPMDGPAPAIVNAVAHATGVRLRRIPLLPEALAEAMEASETAGAAAAPEAIAS